MTDEPTTIYDRQDRESLKSLTFGMVSDLSRLIADQGLAEKPIDLVEALAFAMFIVADTYSLAKCDKDKAIAVIHGFYDDMEEYFIKKVVIKDRQVADADEIQSLADKFHDLSRRRFEEYGARFKQDILDPMSMSCPETVTYFLDNLFIEPISKADKVKLLGVVSDKVIYFWAGCVQSFKGNHAIH
ncbi:MAG: hypothetical protein M1438_13510 [Deltaproteobacteria bacterium]|nr:hypothetical protein [Deltaproteobacteria bacterium]